MKRRMWFARLALGSVLAGSLLATHIPVSKADCLWGYVYVTRKNADPVPVWGPDCIVPDETWTWMVSDSEGTQNHDVPDGTPNGYFYDVVLATP